jgi:hypothetical protein
VARRVGGGITRSGGGGRIAAFFEKKNAKFAKFQNQTYIGFQYLKAQQK